MKYIVKKEMNMFIPTTALFAMAAQTPVIIIAVIAVTGAGVAYGTELIQAQTGYRSYEIADFHADITGIITGSLLGKRCGEILSKEQFLPGKTLIGL